MRIRLSRAWQKGLLLAAIVLASAAYLLFATRMFVAAQHAESNERADLERAAELEPLNATHFYRLGRHAFVDEQDVARSVRMYERAVALDSNSAHYWLDLAVAYNAAGDESAMRHAIARAVSVDSHTPETLWRAANLLVIDGDNAHGFALLHDLIAAAPEYSADATNLAWLATGDVDLVLKQVVPADPEAQLPVLYLAMERQDADAAAKVWQAIVSSHHSFDGKLAFRYVDFALGHNDGATAHRVWQDLARLDPSFAPYVTDNLAINGGFEAPVLDGGLDWRHTQRIGVLLDVMPVEAHSGAHVLSVGLEGVPPTDLGIEQWLALEPAKTYELHAFYKSEVIGVVPPRLAIVLPNRTVLFQSDPMAASSGWQELRGTFTTPPEQSVFILRLVRDGTDTQLRGRLLLDDISVTAQK